MFKPQEFKQTCPKCQAITKSLTKQKCDYCKTELIKIKYYKSKFEPLNNATTWELSTHMILTHPTKETLHGTIKYVHEYDETPQINIIDTKTINNRPYESELDLLPVLRDLDNKKITITIQTHTKPKKTNN